jgi:hypothetical protein
MICLVVLVSFLTPCPLSFSEEEPKPEKPTINTPSEASEYSSGSPSLKERGRGVRQYVRTSMQTENGHYLDPGF